MKCLVAAAVLATGLFGMVVGPVRAEVTAEQVRKAIDRGVSFLKNQQSADGSWTELMPQEHGGITALCTLALLNAGVDPNDEQMQKALELSPQDQARKDLRRRAANDGLCPGRSGAGTADSIDGNVKWLEGKQIAEGRYKGAWTYPGICSAAARATTPIPSSPCWPSTRPSASAFRPATARGDWPRNIGNAARTTTARGAISGRDRPARAA